jgi:hypothetical protein
MACPVPPSVTAPPRNAVLASLLRSIIQPPGCLALRVLGFRTSLWPQPLMKVRTPSPPPPCSIQLLHPRLTVRDGLPLLAPIPTTTRPHGIFVTTDDHQCHPTMTRSVQGVFALSSAPPNLRHELLPCSHPHAHGQNSNQTEDRDSPVYHCIHQCHSHHDVPPLLEHLQFVLTSSDEPNCMYRIYLRHRPCRSRHSSKTRRNQFKYIGLP